MAHRDRKVYHEIRVQQLSVPDRDGHFVADGASPRRKSRGAACEVHHAERAPGTVSPPFAMARGHDAGRGRGGEGMGNPHLVGLGV